MVRDIFFILPLKSVRPYRHRNVFVRHRENKGIPRLVPTSELVLHIRPSVRFAVLSQHLNLKEEIVQEDMKIK